MPGPYKKKAAFSSRKQQGFMFARHPRVAKEMARTAKKHGKPVLARKARKGRRRKK